MPIVVDVINALGPRPKLRIAMVGLIAFAAGCTTTGSIELSDDALPTTPLTVPSSEDPNDTTSTTSDGATLTTPPPTAPPGTVYPTASLGAPVLLFDDGVSALGIDGTLTPIANGAVTAASDLDGGIVYQVAAGPDAEESTAIYWLQAGASEAIEAIAEGSDPITLQGVTRVSGTPNAIYIRHSDPPMLERAPIDGGAGRVLATTAADGAELTRVLVEGPYLTGAWSSEDGSNQGWVLFNASSGDRIGGTRIGGTDPCSTDNDCPVMVTISTDGSLIYRLVPRDDSLHLLVSRSANGQGVADIDLMREADSWYPEQISAQGDAVIISRTQQDDQSSDALPALVVNTTSGEIFQLTDTGLVRPIGL